MDNAERNESLMLKSNSEVMRIIRGAIADECGRKKLAERNATTIISWNDLLKTKLINKNI